LKLPQIPNLPTAEAWKGYDPCADNIRGKNKKGESGGQTTKEDATLMLLLIADVAFLSVHKCIGLVQITNYCPNTIDD
jgi:hypothetical protein